MPVKKFEAKTIKDALALVKSEFGPDAVILAAKDMSKSHGLAGEKSVQVTAAVSDAQLLKKMQAEQSLATDLKERFNNSSATQQKQFIQSVTDEKIQDVRRDENAAPSAAQSKIQQMYSRNKTPAKKAQPKKYKPATRALTETHYMDIVDEPIVAQARPVKVERAPIERPQAVVDGQLKVNPSVARPVKQKRVENQEVLALKKQIQQLRQVVDKFQNVPQNFVSLHPGANEGLPFEVSDVYTKLANTGMEETHIVNILKEACEKLTKYQLKNKSLIEAWVAQYLMSNVYLSPNLFSKKYHVFIGGSGQGKTTTLLKMATQLSLNYKRKIAIVSLDNSRVGVVEQLRTYAQILNIPFVVINHASEWESLYKDLEHIDHVLLDTPSCSKQNFNSINDLKEKLPKVKSNINIHYVQSLLARREDCFDQAQAYLSLGFSDAIFTHIDDSSQYGLIYNFQKRFNVPIHSFGVGPKVPEDYEPATREKFVDLIFNLSGWRKS